MNDCPFCGEALRALAEMFTESVHETWTREEVVNIIEDAIRMGSPLAGPAPSAWQPMTTCPNDDAFRFYGLHVKHTNGSSWFEAHYLSWSDEGTMLLPSGEVFDDWAYSDFEYWTATPSLPSSDRGGVG